MLEPRISRRGILAPPRPSRAARAARSAGGGGRGIQVIQNKEKLISAFDRVRSEAGAAFGSTEVYL